MEINSNRLGNRRNEKKDRVKIDRMQLTHGHQQHHD